MPRDASPPKEDRLKTYAPRTKEQRMSVFEPVLHWLERSRKQDRFEIAQEELDERLKRFEERILEHFIDFVGGPDFISKDEAWRLACRQREFVRECCARMMEDPGGVPTNSSEAIRAIDISENVKIIPDYSRSEA